MIIVHENLTREASEVANALEKALKIKSNLMNHDIGDVLVPIKKFEGYLFSPLKSQTLLQIVPQGKAALLLTSKDFYLGDKNKDDDWVFGANSGNISIVSTQRLKGFDSKPSKEVIVPVNLYLNRLSLLSVHEIGHDVVNAPHFKKAAWVNSKSGYQMDLGLHCTDNKCVMYEVVEIKAPPATEGYLQLGDEKKYDAGVDEALGRLYPSWLCKLCQSSLKIDERYS